MSILKGILLGFSLILLGMPIVASTGLVGNFAAHLDLVQRELGAGWKLRVAHSHVRREGAHATVEFGHSVYWIPGRFVIVTLSTVTKDGALVGSKVGRSKILSFIFVLLELAAAGLVISSLVALASKRRTSNAPPLPPARHDS